MIQPIKKAWRAFVLPLLQRPKRLQVAALCYRHGEKGDKEVLLITSRGTGRWVIPKGWPMRRHGSPDAAMQEAWEEAGVIKAQLERTPIGSYSYDKIKKTGLAQPVNVMVYPAIVMQIVDHFPEADQRKRIWVSPLEAATMVHEPGLQSILRSF
ncbi:MAG: NUDIX hydrolase [Alphaproteobacteria bacterium]